MRAPREVPLPLWALLTLPFGITVGFASIAVPFVLRSRGVPMTWIATVSQAAQLPHVIKLLWSPALDSGPRRRTWYFGSVAVAAAALAATVLIPPSTTERLGPVPLLAVYTAVLFVAQAGVATSSTAVLALMALTVPDARRGAASGWQTAGNLAGTAAGGALVAWMVTHLSGPVTAVTLAAICAVAALPAMLIDEVPPPRRPVGRLLAELLGDVWRTLRSREGWSGMLICLSPVGAGALTNLFGALARDYAPDERGAERLVLFVAGGLGGIVNAAGSLAGGYAADRMNRRAVYAFFGGLTAMCAVAMMLGPATPTAFTVGCLAYQFTNGLCYAAFYAFVFDLLGRGGGVTTRLALYAGASNFAMTYVTWFDGYAYDHARAVLPSSLAAGRFGMLGMDALATAGGLIALGALTAAMRRRRRAA